jgi:hypothetical protein
MNLVMRRTRIASQSLWKESIRQPRQVSGTTQSQHKNMIKTPFGRRAKIHLKRQDLSELSTKKAKALKPSRKNQSSSIDSKNQNNKRPVEQADEHSSGSNKKSKLN